MNGERYYYIASGHCSITCKTTPTITNIYIAKLVTEIVYSMLVSIVLRSQIVGKLHSASTDVIAERVEG